MVGLRVGIGGLDGKLLPLGAMAGESCCPAVCGGFGRTAKILIVLAEVCVKKLIVFADRHIVFRQGQKPIVVKNDEKKCDGVTVSERSLGLL